ncbi:MAG: hypothetical protein AUI15_16040 [Actinobacteria bacterium 13_2_20CM_2_66_6]|nr:MAG: hypothetical protein AUI15_16040 [Actinobacteria bacterium 13_2_20CM_2_66_6]
MARADSLAKLAFAYGVHLTRRRLRRPRPQLAALRLYSRLGEVSSDLEGESPDLVAAAAVCPVGVPLEEVAAVVRRLTGR